MESIAVEAVSQIPALLLAILAFYFYRSAKKNETASLEPVGVSEEIATDLKSASDAIERIESQIADMQKSVEEFESLTARVEESEESIRSQLSNQKMALKEFGRVLSKTSEQTYTEFGSFEERLSHIEDGLKERGMIEDSSRSAAA